MKPPFHVNYYLAPTNEVERRIANIKTYYYMQGLRVQVKTQALDNDDDKTLLVTCLFKVDVDEEAIRARFRQPSSAYDESSRVVEDGREKGKRGGPPN